VRRSPFLASKRYFGAGDRYNPDRAGGVDDVGVAEAVSPSGAMSGSRFAQLSLQACSPAGYSL
jgi:hypothetical protein